MTSESAHVLPIEESTTGPTLLIEATEERMVEPGGATVTEPPNPVMEECKRLLPFPTHWDSHLQLSTSAIFERGRLDEAVRDATLRLEARIRALCAAPADRIGVELVGDAFKTSGGFLEPTGLPMAEREGLHHLFRGAIQQIRNPVGHRSIGQNPGPAYDTIAFVNYLLGVAEQAALARYVYPFVGRWSGARVIEGVHRCDLNGDGDDEIVVVMRWQDSSGQPLASALILKHDGLSPMTGAMNPMPASIVSAPVFEDLDADGRRELLISGGTQSPSGWLWRGSVIDVGDAGTVREFGSSDKDFNSLYVPFEVLRPMHTGVVVVAGLASNSEYRHWQFDGSALVQFVDFE